MLIVDLMSHEEIAEELGRRIKSCRMAQNLTQKDLAQNCGISRSAVQELESGASSLDSFLRVVGYLGLTQSIIDVIKPQEAQTIAEVKAAQTVRQRVRK